MITRDRRTPLWVIWALLAGFAVMQASVWYAAGGIPRRPAVLSQVLSAWGVMLVLAWLATRRIEYMEDRIRQQEQTHQATMSEIAQLQTQNAILEVIARSADVTLAFQALASRVAGLVPCDRVGLALLSEDSAEFQTYTARVSVEERRTRPRPEIMFKADASLLGRVVRTREPLVVANIEEFSADNLDANVLQSAGFRSCLLVPLMSKGRAVGTLNFVSRKAGAFDIGQAAGIQPIAELFAVAVIAQQLQLAIGRYRSTEVMADLTLSISAEINSALQTIVGHCDLLERGYPDPGIQRDLATVVVQAQRIAALLEKMRTAANERLREVEAAVTQSQARIPSSPEGFQGIDI
jgi:GAF domain-containing protein